MSNPVFGAPTATVESLSQISSFKSARRPQPGQCQKCLGYGHWTYECKNNRQYVHRPSRTKQLGKPRLASDQVNKNGSMIRSSKKGGEDTKGLADKILAERARARKKARRDETSSSGSDSSDSDSSDDTSSSSDSDSSSDSSDSDSSSDGSSSDSDSESESDSSSSASSSYERSRSSRKRRR
ncbi:zinc knuckle-domain-containing protein [Gaertneriomyces semiglobifer]|nr:zinc knuckle-domain-containing protein [Gaertneriomyces semiglobifer]